jgi:A/G-specific adenine glycosylase
MPPAPTAARLHEPLRTWFDASARVLPWRGGGATGWRVLVSEVMLQQTPVARVQPVFDTWVARWPAPAALAADSPGEAVRAWGRLGYPRRALRLHRAAVACVQQFGGAVPEAYEDLRSLPGVGDYTAAAVASFAYGRRHAVLDTNVRRVLARAAGGQARQPAGAARADERQRAEELLPDDGDRCARWNAAVMELGALVCRARTPRCGICPLAAHCRWRLAGAPPWTGPVAPPQRYAGTDRQARGRLLAILREADGPVDDPALAGAWGDQGQRERALAGLVADGLVVPAAPDRWRLP